MHRWLINPRRIQAGLVLVALAYLAAWAFAPDWVLRPALVGVLVLSLAGGVITFLAAPPRRAAHPHDSSPADPGAAAAEVAPAAEPAPEPARCPLEPVQAFSADPVQFAQHGRDILAQAEQLLLKGGPEAEAGLRLYDAERQLIAAGHALALAAASQPAMTQLVRDYPLAGANVLALRQKTCERTAWLRAACAAARQLGGRPAPAIYLGQVARAYARGGRTHQAISYYALCARLAQCGGDCQAAAVALARTGLIYAAQRQPLRALVYYRRHQQLVRGLGDRSAEAWISWNTGLAYAELGDLPKAIAAMQSCVDFERETGHPEAEADAANLARLRQRQRAIEAYWISRAAKAGPG
jgi:tetratricopeptide (TPR) repeat protein